MSTGIVYTETIVHAPPQQYATDAPYQLAIIDLDTGGRHTVRILLGASAHRVAIGDRVQFVEERAGVAFYRRADSAT